MDLHLLHQFVDRSGADELIIHACIYDPLARCGLDQIVKELMSGQCHLLADVQLLGEVLRIPEQPLVIHRAVGPMADCGHRDGEALAGGGR